LTLRDVIWSTLHMADLDAVNAIPIVGEPLAYGLALVALVLVVFARSWAGGIVTVAHEGGHMVMRALTFKGLKHFTLDNGGGGATYYERGHWSVGDLLCRFAGYPMPCLLGLGGAALIAAGRPASVLWISLVLVLGALALAGNSLAYVVTTIEAIGIGWIAFDGSLALQSGVAVALVWMLLLGGAYESSIVLSREDTSDAANLAQRTWIPRIVWHAAWAVIGVVCLWNGGGWLLGLG
jgi:hypothetical protein